MRVGQLHVQSLGTGNNLKTLTGADIVGNLGGEHLVLHHEHVELGSVVDGDLAEAIGHQVTGDGVGTVTDLGHGGLAGEATTDTVINTLGLAPALL